MAVLHLTLLKEFFDWVVLPVLAGWAMWLFSNE